MGSERPTSRRTTLSSSGVQPDPGVAARGGLVRAGRGLHRRDRVRAHPHAVPGALRNRAARPGEPVADAVRAALDDMSLPVVATSMTTAVGFLSFAIFSKMLANAPSLEGVDHDKLRAAITRGLQNQDGRARGRGG